MIEVKETAPVWLLSRAGLIFMKGGTDMSKVMRKIEEEIRRRGVNLYDFALMTDGGIEEIHTQPCNACNNSYSVTKAFVATAAGVLWERGQLDLDRPVTEFFREYTPKDEAWSRVTMRHALTHTMGIGKGYLDIDVEDIYSYGTEDFLEVVFREPLPHEPGSHYCYSDAAYYLASRVVEEAAGERTDGFLMREILLPMKVQEAAFSCCPGNHIIGATGLYIRARDMVKLGWLYAGGGEYEGKQLISDRWIAEEEKGNLAFTACGKGGARGKGGMCGQMLMFSREKRFAAAWHSFTTDDKLNGLAEFIEKIF